MVGLFTGFVYIYIYRHIILLNNLFIFYVNYNTYWTHNLTIDPTETDIILPTTFKTGILFIPLYKRAFE